VNQALLVAEKYLGHAGPCHTLVYERNGVHATYDNQRLNHKYWLENSAGFSSLNAETQMEADITKAKNYGSGEAEGYVATHDSCAGGTGCATCTGASTCTGSSGAGANAHPHRV